MKKRLNVLLRNIDTVVGYGVLVGLLIVAVLARLGLAGHTFGEIFPETAIVFMVAILVAVLRLSHRVSTVKARIEDPLSERWQSDVLESVPPMLREVYRTEVEHFCEQLRETASNSRISLRNRPFNERFRDGYLAALEQLRGAELYATSLPEHAFFWRPQKDSSGSPAESEVEIAIRRFISGNEGEYPKGAMHRLFFVKDTKRLTVEEKDTLTRQHALGVQVYMASRSSLAGGDDRLFVIDAQGKRFAWQAWTVAGGCAIDHVRATQNRADLAELHRLRLKLFDENRLQRFSPGAQ